MIDPLASLVAHGRAKAAPAPVEGEVLPRADLSALSGPKAALADALEEILGMITGNAGRLPLTARMLVHTLQGMTPMATAAVANMDEDEAHRIVSVIHERAAAALGVGA